MPFVLGTRSRRALRGVHPGLVAVVQRAITLTRQDFSVFEGLRTIDRQEVLFRRGFSMTTHSKHLRQPDGFAHAVDLVPYVNGRLDWSDGALHRYDPIEAAVYRAAAEVAPDLKLRWGGDWNWKDYAHWEIR